MKRDLILDGNRIDFSVDDTPDGICLKLNGADYLLTCDEAFAGRLKILDGDRAHRARVVRDKEKIHVWLEGRTFEFTLPSSDGEEPGGEEQSRNEVHAPMPGTLIKLDVAAGDRVEEGQTVAVVEAMKMEHNLRAPRAGKVASVSGSVGEIVNTDTAIVVLADEE